MIEFPKKFLWGAATSSYQVEGNNIHSDWWHWEREGKIKYHSAEACRHYQFYKEDFRLAKDLNHNAHRLSIEWSRLEPEEGKFSSEAIAHYKQVIAVLRECNIEPIVTLHHFTLPNWLMRKGGWHKKKSVFYFLRYAQKIVEELSPSVNYWLTINEPFVYIYYAYIQGDWPPQKRSFFKAYAVMRNMGCAHIKTYNLIRQIYKTNKLNLPLISIAHNMQSFSACSPKLENKLAVYLRKNVFNLYFIEELVKFKSLDFIGVNYYSRNTADVKTPWLKSLFLDNCRDNCGGLKKNSMGWDIYPEGLYDVLMQVKKYNLPVMVTENGICTNDDSQRWDFIREHLINLHRAIKDGVNVTGYLYWSLLDNFEWDKGFAPRFGLIEIDYLTFARKIRKSAQSYAQVCKTGRLDGYE